jgi:hypothetical protein
VLVYATSGQILFPQVQVAGCGRPIHRGRNGVFLALIYLKAVVGYPHGFQCLRWESGFILGEASLTGRFFAPLQGDSIQAHLSSAVDPTAAAWADEIHSFLTTEHTI